MKNKEKIFVFLITFITFSISFYNWNDICPTEALNSASKILDSVRFFPNIILMDLNYQGINFFWIPSFAIFGFELIAIRLPQSLFIAISVLITYFFAKDFYNKKTAIMSSLILILFPAFILMKHNAIPFFPFFTSSFYSFEWLDKTYKLRAEAEHGFNTLKEVLRLKHFYVRGYKRVKSYTYLQCVFRLGYAMAVDKQGKPVTKTVTVL
jgi:hypothetical protein